MVHPEEERQEIFEGKSRTRIHENCMLKSHQNSGTIGDHLWVLSKGGQKRNRNRIAPTFKDRDPNNTLWAEDGASRAAWQWATKLNRLRGNCMENESTFFKPRMEWEVASTATVNPDEGQFIVDSTASLHMMNKMALSPEE